jgi:hypothetical protein
MTKNSKFATQFSAKESIREIDGNGTARRFVRLMFQESNLGFA